MNDLAARLALLAAMIVLHGATGAGWAALNVADTGLAARLLLGLPLLVLYLLSGFVLLLAPLAFVAWLRSSRRSTK